MISEYSDNRLAQHVREYTDWRNKCVEELKKRGYQVRVLKGSTEFCLTIGDGFRIFKNTTIEL